MVVFPTPPLPEEIGMMRRSVAMVPGPLPGRDLERADLRLPRRVGADAARHLGTVPAALVVPRSPAPRGLEAEAALLLLHRDQGQGQREGPLVGQGPPTRLEG